MEESENLVQKDNYRTCSPSLTDTVEDKRERLKEHREISQERNIGYQTHDGQPLTAREQLFIEKYLETNNGAQAIRDAGYNIKNPSVQANKMLRKPRIASEIKFRIEQRRSESIASADEILQYFTSVMRGEINDQFGLEASLSERTKAAQELARRQIDVVNKLAGKEEAPEVKITLNWAQ